MANIYQELRNKRDENGIATITAKQTAVLIRQSLKKHFPNVKFSVRSDFNSVNISWVDGPCSWLVDQITDRYSFGGFDGMIDLSYSTDNWLLPDGRMSPAFSCGTEGSGGSVSGFATDCPQPGAILVRYGPKYISTCRHETASFLLNLVLIAAKYWGFEVAETQPLYNQRFNGNYITSLAIRLEADKAKEAMAESTR